MAQVKVTDPTTGETRMVEVGATNDIGIASSPQQGQQAMGPVSLDLSKPTTFTPPPPQAPSPSSSAMPDLTTVPRGTLQALWDFLPADVQDMVKGAAKITNRNVVEPLANVAAAVPDIATAGAGMVADAVRGFANPQTLQATQQGFGQGARAGVEGLTELGIKGERAIRPYVSPVDMAQKLATATPEGARTVGRNVISATTGLDVNEMADENIPTRVGEGLAAAAMALPGIPGRLMEGFGPLKGFYVKAATENVLNKISAKPQNFKKVGELIGSHLSEDLKDIMGFHEWAKANEGKLITRAEVEAWLASHEPKFKEVEARKYPGYHMEEGSDYGTYKEKILVAPPSLSQDFTRAPITYREPEPWGAGTRIKFAAGSGWDDTGEIITHAEGEGPQGKRVEVEYPYQWNKKDPTKLYDTVEEAKADLERRWEEAEIERATKKNEYSGGHFSDIAGARNQFAHARVSHHLNIPGFGRTYVLEEMQSDPIQAARKLGGVYRTPSSAQAAEQKYTGTREARARALRALNNVKNRNWGSYTKPLDALANESDYTADKLMAQARTIHPSIGELPEAEQAALRTYAEAAVADENERDIYTRVKHAAPASTPYKKRWHDLLFRVGLRDAVDAGFDNVAWTTGAEQIKRYARQQNVELSSKIGKIRVTTTPGAVGYDQPKIQLWTKAGEPHTDSGEVGRFIEDMHSARQLPVLIGEGGTSAYLEQPAKWTGQSLVREWTPSGNINVGGRGHYEAYDWKTVEIANAEARRFYPTDYNLAPNTIHDFLTKAGFSEEQRTAVMTRVKDVLEGRSEGGVLHKALLDTRRPGAVEADIVAKVSKAPSGKALSMWETQNLVADLIKEEKGKATPLLTQAEWEEKGGRSWLNTFGPAKRVPYPSRPPREVKGRPYERTQYYPEYHDVNQFEPEPFERERLPGDFEATDFEREAFDPEQHFDRYEDEPVEPEQSVREAMENYETDYDNADYWVDTEASDFEDNADERNEVLSTIRSEYRHLFGTDAQQGALFEGQRNPDAPRAGWTFAAHADQHNGFEIVATDARGHEVTVASKGDTEFDSLEDAEEVAKALNGGDELEANKWRFKYNEGDGGRTKTSDWFDSEREAEREAESKREELDTEYSDRRYEERKEEVQQEWNDYESEHQEWENDRDDAEKEHEAAQDRLEQAHEEEQARLEEAAGRANAEAHPDAAAAHAREQDRLEAEHRTREASRRAQFDEGEAARQRLYEEDEARRRAAHEAEEDVAQRQYEATGKHLDRTDIDPREVWVLKLPPEWVKEIKEKGQALPNVVLPLTGAGLAAYAASRRKPKEQEKAQ